MWGGFRFSWRPGRARLPAQPLSVTGLERGHVVGAPRDPRQRGAPPGTEATIPGLSPQQRELHPVGPA